MTTWFKPGLLSPKGLPYPFGNGVLGIAPQPSVLLWYLLGANMNVTTDQAFVKTFPFTLYQIDHIRVSNASTSLTTAAGGIYDTASKGGTPLVAAAQAYTALTGATLGLDLTMAAYGLGDRSGAALFLALTTGNGGAATADIRVYGNPLA